MKGINKSMTAKRLKRGISAMMKCQKFFLSKGRTSEYKKLETIIQGQSKLIGDLNKF